MLNLSENQIKILKTIKQKVDNQGYPPSVREICCITGIKSTSTVHSNMNKLEELGFIKRDPTKPRAIEILNYIEEDIPGLNQEIIELPVVEFLTMDSGIEENIIETIKLPSSLVVGKDNFICKVKDNKLIEIGVLKNDYVIVDRSNSIKNGKIVMAITNNETILGRYFKNEDKIKLEFENCSYDPLILKQKDFDIIGQVRGNLRVIK